MRFALYALTAGAFGIGVTEFVILGLLLEVGAEFGVSIQAAGWLISGCALAPNKRASAMARRPVLLGLLTTVIFVGLLGAAAFATVAPLQMWVLDKAQGAGQSLASSFNIAAFNLGNAVGAWLGGIVIAHGPGHDQPLPELN